MKDEHQLFNMWALITYDLTISQATISYSNKEDILLNRDKWYIRKSLGNNRFLEKSHEKLKDIEAHACMQTQIKLKMT